MLSPNLSVLRDFEKLVSKSGIFVCYADLEWWGKLQDFKVKHWREIGEFHHAFWRDFKPRQCLEKS